MSRIYVVNETQTGWKHLVEAESQAQAIGVIVRDRYEAKAATPQEVAQLMTEGKTLQSTKTAPAAADAPAA